MSVLVVARAVVSGTRPMSKELIKKLWEAVRAELDPKHDRRAQPRQTKDRRRTLRTEPRATDVTEGDESREQ